MWTDSLPDLAASCDAELARLVTEFESVPSRENLLNLGAVAEILVLCDGVRVLQPLRTLLCDACAKWLASGLLEDLLFIKVEFAYHAALFTFLAQQSRAYSAEDLDIMQRLCTANLVCRNEMPVLTQHLITRYLTRCGIQTEVASLGLRDLARMIDKRLLRARTDEYEIFMLIMCAQLTHLDGPSRSNMPRLQPQLLLMQAIRANEMNWLPVLAFLCACFVRVPEDLGKAAFTSLLEALPSSGQLLAFEKPASSDEESIERGVRGLRLRSTLALVASLYTLGETYVDEWECLVVR